MRIRTSFETWFGIGALAAEVAVAFLIHLDVGDRKSIWDVAVFIEIAKVEPLRIAKSVTGHLRVTGRPTRHDPRRMSLRVKYRDARNGSYTNDEFYLKFVPPISGVPLEARLVVTRDLTDTP